MANVPHFQGTRVTYVITLADHIIPSASQNEGIMVIQMRGINSEFNVRGRRALVHWIISKQQPGRSATTNNATLRIRASREECKL